jgi:hypothetical protein
VPHRDNANVVAKGQPTAKHRRRLEALGERDGNHGDRQGAGGKECEGQKRGEHVNEP